MEHSFENSSRNPENLLTGCFVEWLTATGYEKCFAVESITPMSSGPLGLSVGAVVRIRRLDEDGNVIEGGEYHDVSVSYGAECELNVFAYVNIFSVPVHQFN